MNNKEWEKYNEDIHQDRQTAPVFFTGDELENIEKEQIKLFIAKHIVKVILSLLLAVIGLIFYLT